MRDNATERDQQMLAEAIAEVIKAIYKHKEPRRCDAKRVMSN